MDKGIGSDRHGPLPSHLPSPEEMISLAKEANSDDSTNSIVNLPQRIQETACPVRHRKVQSKQHLFKIYLP